MVEGRRGTVAIVSWVCGGSLVATHPVYTVIGTHNSPRPSIPHRNFKRFKIDLPQCPLINYLIHRESPRLLFVRDEMLHRDSDILGLYTVDIRSGQLSSKVRVFGEGLEVSSSEWRAVVTGCWSKENVGFLSESFFSQSYTDFAD